MPADTESVTPAFVAKVRNLSAAIGAIAFIACGEPGPAATTPTPTTTPIPSVVTPDPTAANEDTVVSLVNAKRAAGAVCGGTSFAAVPPLVHNTQLRNAARAHSADMAARGYFAHVGPDGRTFTQRISAAGYTGSLPWAENIASGQAAPQAVVDGWMASATHCANIMSPEFRSVGVGYAFNATSPLVHFWTQDFGAGQ